MLVHHDEHLTKQVKLRGNVCREMAHDHSERPRTRARWENDDPDEDDLAQEDEDAGLPGEVPFCGQR